MKILIIYQHRVREYDNALLLKAALEKRGHRVEIKHDAAQMSLFRRYDFYLFPCLYDNNQLDFLTYRFNVYNKPIINMRYEQVSTKYDFESGSMAPREEAKKIPAINWGKYDFDYCKMFGMKTNDLKITGHLALDFLRDDFSSFWYTKEDVAQMFNIDSHKKWVLFISTLAYAEDKMSLEKSSRFFGKSKELFQVAEAHTKTRKELLKWVNSLLEQDICFIYRPHPSERTESSIQIKKMIKRHKNKFFVIDRLNIKQWILVSDVVTSWMSSAIVECYFAKKNCLVLRPEGIFIPEEWDSLLYLNAETVTTYDKFQKIISLQLKNETNKEICDFPISDDYICAMYEVSDVPTYKKIVNVIEEYKDSRRDVGSKLTWNIKRFGYLYRNHVCFKIVGKRVYQFFNKYFNYSITDEKIREKFAVGLWESEVRQRKQNKEDERNKNTILKQIVE